MPYWYCSLGSSHYASPLYEGMNNESVIASTEPYQADSTSPTHQAASNPGERAVEARITGSNVDEVAAALTRLLSHGVSISVYEVKG